jgi:putative transposase
MRIDEIYRKRCQRLNLAGQAHELTFSCYQNQNFLKSQRACRYLTEAIIAARQAYDFSLWAYVFMPNHVHLLICPRQASYSISRILKSIKQPVSRKIIDYLKQHRPSGLSLLETGLKHPAYRFWQAGGGYDRNVSSEETLLHTIRYIHRNPVRKELVAQETDWPYSSARQWLNNEPGPLELDFDDYPLK